MSEPLDIVVNGKGMQVSACRLSELLDQLGYAEGRVATAVNGEFVTRSARTQTMIAFGDKIEVVSARQGG